MAAVPSCFGLKNGGKVKYLSSHCVSFAFLLLMPMLFRKFNADSLFTGTTLLDHNQVLVTDTNGIVQDIIPIADAGEDVMKLEGVLSPGFINCHCHLELSHMKGLIPEKTGLVDFVFKVVSQRHFPDEEIFAAVETAETGMLKNGIVAVGDICNNTLSLPQKIKQRLFYHNFIEASGWLPAVADTRFKRALQYYHEFKNAQILPGAKSTIVPHASYSVSNELWQAITPYFTGKVASIHNQETLHEDEFFQQGTGDFLRMYTMMKLDNSFHQPTGKSSLQSYLHRLSAAASLLLVHNSYTSDADIVFAMTHARDIDQALYWCICINANKYIEDCVPAVDKLRKRNARIVLGTDSLASNYSLNLLDEMKTVQEHFPQIELAEMLQWATLNGSEALQMDDQLGSFETGKQPGIVHIANLQAGKIFSGTTVHRIL